MTPAPVCPAAAAGNVETMADINIKLTYQELMRIKMIVVDSDRDSALDFVRDILRRADISANAGLKNHLDK
jgi:hypothetical protein